MEEELMTGPYATELVKGARTGNMGVGGRDVGEAAMHPAPRWWIG